MASLQRPQCSEVCQLQHLHISGCVGSRSGVFRYFASQSRFCSDTEASITPGPTSSRVGGGPESYTTSLQVDEVYLRLYKSIGLSTKQRCFLADFWATWLQRRQALDDDLTAALDRVAVLPTPDHITPELLAALDRMASSPPREIVFPLCEPHPTAAPALPPFFVPRQLLGMSVPSTRAAEAAVLALVDAHSRDARQMEDFLSGFVMPAWFMTAAQRARLNCAHVRHECVPMEMLVVCRMAAADQRRDMYSRPPRLPLAGSR